MTPREKLYEQKQLFYKRIDEVLLQLLSDDPTVNFRIINLMVVLYSEVEREESSREEPIGSAMESYRQALLEAAEEATPEVAEAYQQEAKELEIKMAFLVELLTGFRTRQGLGE
jgi:hypothetical protein